MLDKGPLTARDQPFLTSHKLFHDGTSSELGVIATVPERHTEALRVGMHSFALPVSVRDHGFTALASEAGCRSSTSLAARMRSGRLRQAVHTPTRPRIRLIRQRSRANAAGS
jgi:hypothetical protein